MRQSLFAAAIASTLGITASVHAAPLLFNLSPNSATSGTAATATVADFEAAGLPANLTTGASDGLVLYQDIDGSGTAPTNGSPASGIILNGGGFYYNGGGNIPSDPSGPAAAVYQEVELANPGGTQSTTIAGLSSSSEYGLLPNTAYDLYVFPVTAINGDNLIVSASYGSEQATFTNVPSATPVLFQFTTGATVSDQLSFSDTDYGYPTFSGDRSYPGYASFAIVQAPEPATLSLITLCAAGNLLRRRARAR
jgi:hypothetical protein